jgi:hypothetical protein
MHACEVVVTFPTNLQARQALRVLQVDKEPSDRVTRSFHYVVRPRSREGDDVSGDVTVHDGQAKDDDEHDDDPDVVTSMKVYDDY